MVFSSQLFLFIFLPIVMVGYYWANHKARNIWLLILSLFFYAWGEPIYIVLMIGSIAINYIIGLLVDKNKETKLGLVLIIIGCVINIGLLGVFKYSGFFVQNINGIFGLDISIPEISLPIGISFYTFQSLSYVIDVYRGTVPAQRSLVNLALYISFFPQLIAGPIVRYVDIEQQINQRECSLDKIYCGIQRFIIGFVKKILIADSAAVTANTIFAAEDVSSGIAWIGIIAYSIQIYFDFSGYSDMAIGLGKMFGFDFIENFNYPYISKSIQEFWRRWHISLGSWFRDYVYIPLGGSKKGVARTYINTIIVFFLTGFWHGASWNFIVWGLYYAVFLVMERAFLRKYLEKIPAFISHIYTVLVVIVGWVFFRADNLTHAMGYLRDMFAFTSTESDVLFSDLMTSSLFFVILGIVFSMPIFKLFEQKANKTEAFRWVYDIALIIGFALAVLNLNGSGFTAFLYFRF